MSCDFDVKKLPIKLSAFYQQVLFYWKMMYKHNFSPNVTPLWNCRYIVHRNKSLFDKQWFEKGIWSVMHLIEDNGSGIMTYEQFCEKDNLNDRKQYDIIVKAIPPTTVVSSCNLFQSGCAPHLPDILINGFHLSSSKLSNAILRTLLVKELYPL